MAGNRPNNRLEEDNYIEYLLGKWKTSYGKNGKGEWNIHRDGRVVNADGLKGNWEKKDSRIIIRWGSNGRVWDTLDFPLNQATVSGDSWAGANWISASKQGFRGATQRSPVPFRVDDLLGKWKISNKSKDEWTFHRDGSAVNRGGMKGRWNRKDSRIIIRWERDNCWDTLDFPLNQEIVSGDSWVGPSNHTASKVSTGN